MNVSGKTRICGIIGNPIEHTLSPIMHNAAFKELDLDFIYVAFKVEKECLREAMEGIRALGIHGLNVTIPYKEKIIPFLDEISPEAKIIGSVNTILNQSNKLIGYNTDGIGAVKALEDNKVELIQKNVILLGAGGAAKSIAFHFSQKAKKIMILNRTLDRGKKLAESLRSRSNADVCWDQLSREAIRNHLKKADILINATSVGMNPESDVTLVDPNWLNPEIFIFDIVYGPVETKLIRDAKKIGAKTMDGIDMLVYQGAMAFTIWTGNAPPIKKMKETIVEKIKELRNK